MPRKRARPKMREIMGEAGARPLTVDDIPAIALAVADVLERRQIVAKGPGVSALERAIVDAAGDLIRGGSGALDLTEEQRGEVLRKLGVHARRIGRLEPADPPMTPERREAVRREVRTNLRRRGIVPANDGPQPPLTDEQKRAALGIHPNARVAPTNDIARAAAKRALARRPPPPKPPDEPA